MLIDWFTVGAQVLNFIVLVWLLKRFLYKPILNAVDTREKLIAAELADAAAKKAEAKTESDTFRQKNEAFDQQRAALLSNATSEAAAERQRLLDEARKAADALATKRQKALTTQSEALNDALRMRAQQEVFAIARKTLTDLAGASLEARMTEVFVRRLQTMDAKAKASLAAALTSTGAPALVQSAFDLPADQRAVIQKAVQALAAKATLRFETSGDLVGGIELSANGQKISWSIADYLASLEHGVADLLKANDRPSPKSGAKPAAAKRPPKPRSTPKAKPLARARVAKSKPKRR
jgi:F-type H+-transporting ATPase subunit b